jgi:hypothetical protein
MAVATAHRPSPDLNGLLVRTCRENPERQRWRQGPRGCQHQPSEWVCQGLSTAPGHEYIYIYISTSRVGATEHIYIHIRAI